MKNFFKKDFKKHIDIYKVKFYNKKDKEHLKLNKGRKMILDFYLT